MAAINELISRIQDPELRASIQAEVDKLSRQKKCRRPDLKPLKQPGPQA